MDLYKWLYEWFIDGLKLSFKVIWLCKLSKIPLLLNCNAFTVVQYRIIALLKRGTQTKSVFFAWCTV